ncbi:ATP-dependent RNA helicase DbpA [Alteromonas oceanisediminis]|uniref:ATP-dependent RNA helicase DbpA n=1 Tax=Alteromonas oceanisediminis TaxID=2836180 RepID=UPI001BDB3D43|nr:ATP-dependent RNA helicase DbpA [Alteromonas oceanisediminis]MBT0586986.1 ATP-dependent RNA helicase DbpA [Alteromonas oceanisediminis]
MTNTTDFSFSSLPLRDDLREGLVSLGFDKATPVQMQSLPHSLTGRDIVAQAQTGSGKTLAFALTLLNNLDSSLTKPSALVLCPTRELAEQVAEQIRTVAKNIANTKVLLLCGGVPVPPQISSLAHGANVIVGTPGRVVDHIMKGRLILSSVHHFVLDEADRMLDMGFEDELKVINRALPRAKQTLLFSATFPPSVESIVASVVTDAERITVNKTESFSHIRQRVYRVDEAQRLPTLCAVLTDQQPSSAIVFCITKKETQQVASELNAAGFSVVALHGDLEQRERTEMLAQFTAGSALTLVATDVAARGLDIEDVPLVINYRLSDDADTHIHRIGRTGRAGKKGMAISLMSDDEEIRAARIEEQLQIVLEKSGGQALRFHANRIVQPDMACISVAGGKKDKLRPGDLLGALTQDAKIPVEDIGKIKITSTHSYLAIKARSVKRALGLFRDGKIKGKRFRARKLNALQSY